MTNKHVMAVASGICSATLLFAFGGTAYGHDDDWSRTDKPLVWVDSQGKIIGRATTTKLGDSAVQLRIKGLSLIVPIANITATPCTNPFVCETFRKVSWGSQAVYFSELNCTGIPYVGAFFLTPGSDRALGVRGHTLYVGNDELRSKLITYQSVSGSGAECFNSPPPLPGGDATQAHVWDVKDKIDLRTLGKPSFYLK